MTNRHHQDDDDDTDQLIQSLFQAYNECNERGLVTSATWNADQLQSLLNGETFEPKVPLSQTFDSKYLYAKALFDGREYARASYFLKGKTDEKPHFLCYYAKFLHIQSMNSFSEVGSLCIEQPASIKNQEDLMDVFNELEKISNKDSYQLYLLGVICLELKMLIQAKQHLIESLQNNPWNWSCWLALFEFCDKPSTLQELSAHFQPSHILNCWRVMALNELHSDREAVLPVLDEVIRVNRTNQFPVMQAAILQHNARDFENAEIIFLKLHEQDPFLIESMDLYSNVLYVRREYTKLCELAHNLSITDRYRPETCVCIGNYFSLKCNREKAIESFSRAIKLDHTYCPAYTLLGHEYVDSMNPKAAIEIYRMAVDINPRDFRGWYGLGQAYDLLQLPSYSIYYHQRAIAIRPNDGRMWLALGNALEATGRIYESIKCLKRVMLSQQDCAPQEFGKCAHLYASLFLGERVEKFEVSAAYYFRKYLSAQEDSQDSDSTGEYVDEANTFLYQYYRKRGEKAKSERYT